MPESAKSRFKPLYAHPLPVAPVFRGREAELEQMRLFLESSNGVLSLVGVGGAGKTVTVERFLREVVKYELVDGLLVWSFYDDPDTNAFLRTAVHYLTGDTSERQGSGWFQTLRLALDSSPNALLVLDGLEKVQRPITSSEGVFGELEDPLLKALVTRLATSSGGAKAIITSRFPIADLEGRVPHRYTVINIDELPYDSARHVLESHGVTGEKPEIDRLFEHYGRHALTVDLLGAAIARFFGSEVAACPLAEVGGEFSDEKARRLAEVLGFFEQRLDERERDMMNRLCVFRFGVGIDTLADVFHSADQSVGGSLSGMSEKELGELADRLAQTHLLHKDGTRYSVHPAVRDHFYSAFRDSAQMHGAVTKHLLSLSNRPGVGLPTTKEALDLLEELIYHALKSGNREEARDIYAYRLGGSEHLSTNLGEYARTHRILKAFGECPDAGGMYHCLRAFGAFDEALQWRPQNRYIQLAQGRLVLLSQDPSNSARTAAGFLMGDRVTPPDRSPDFPIPAAALLTLTGRFDDALVKCRQEIAMSMYVDDIVRNRLALVEVLIRKGQPSLAEKELEEVAHWILRSGSQEHLCIYYLQMGRHALSRHELREAQSALAESRQLAQEAGFNLFLVDILVESANASFELGLVEEADRQANEALRLARDEQMRYAWGEAAALSALTRIRGRASSKSILNELLELQRRIGHPEASATQRLVSQSA